jgi:hypothetical protein
MYRAHDVSGVGPAKLWGDAVHAEQAPPTPRQKLHDLIFRRHDTALVPHCARKRSDRPPDRLATAARGAPLFRRVRRPGRSLLFQRNHADANSQSCPRHIAGVRLTLKPLGRVRGCAGGRWLGISDEKQDAEERHVRAAELKPRRQAVRLLGREIPVIPAADGTLRAEDDGKPASAKSVQSYVARAFGDRLAEARAACGGVHHRHPCGERNMQKELGRLR